MSQRANPVVVGGFMVAMIALCIFLVVFVGTGNLSSYSSSRYELLYSSSIKGLNVGAPVALKGVKIGEVVSITAKIYPEKLDVLNSVVIDVDPKAMVRVGEPDKRREEVIQELLGKGLSAQLKMQSLLTGLLYIEVNFYPQRERNTFPIETEYPQIPTVPSDLEQLTQNLEGFDLRGMAEDMKGVIAGLNQVLANEDTQALPTTVNHTMVAFGDMSGEMKKMAIGMRQDMAAMRAQMAPMAAEIRQMAGQLNEEVPGTVKQLNSMLAELENTLVAARGTLERAENAMDPDSPLLYQMEQSAKDMSRAARAVEEMAELLEKKPSSVLYGK